MIIPLNLYHLSNKRRTVKAHVWIKKKERKIYAPHAFWIVWFIVIMNETTYIKSARSSFMARATQWLASSSSQNLEYLSASIKFFTSPLSLTSTLIIHPFSYGLELIYIKTARSETSIKEMKEKKKKNIFLITELK